MALAHSGLTLSKNLLGAERRPRSWCLPGLPGVLPWGESRHKESSLGWRFFANHRQDKLLISKHQHAILINSRGEFNLD